MNQRLKLVLCCVVVVGLALWVSWPKPVPSWGGKTVNEWLVELKPDEWDAHRLILTETNVRQLEARDRRRKTAQEAIRNIGKSAVPYVLVMMKEEPKRPRWLEQIAKPLGWKLPGLPSREVLINRAALAIEALGEDARPAIPALKLMLSDTNTMGAAAYCLGMAGSFGVPALVSGLSSPNNDTRIACLTRIGFCGTNATAAMPAVLGTISDPNPLVSGRAVFAFARIEPDKQQLIETLLSWSRTNGAGIHPIMNGMQFVGTERRPHGPEVQPLITELLRLADHSDERIQAHALHSLAKFGNSAAQAQAKAVAATESTSVSVRRSACLLLGELRADPEITVPLLVHLADSDADAFVRNAAVHAATCFGEAGLPFCGPLRATVEGEIHRVAEQKRMWNRVSPK